MSHQAKLHLSPFVLSTLMFDNSNSSGDQEGFLIGNAQKSIRREISDHSMYNTEEDLIISIYSCIPCGGYLSFYDTLGNVNEPFLEEFLGERRNSIVGWYRYRRNVVAFPSGREMIVHKRLTKLFPGNISFGDEYFLFGVFGSACYPTTATHTYDYAFFVQKCDSFRPLPITLLNLGDTKTEYRNGSLSGSFVQSSTFGSLLNIPWDFSSCWQTEDAMQQMHKMLREKCDNLAEELAASESVNSIIEQEINKLDEEMEILSVKEPVEPTSVEKNFDYSENNPAERVFLPFGVKKTKLFGKRNVKDLIDLNEELHPLYGKYFPQNRNQEPGCSYTFTGEVSGMNYNFLPPKKKIKVILQERRRILDHDYDAVSEVVRPHELMPEPSENTYNNIPSNTSGFTEDEDVYNQVANFEETGEIADSSSSRMPNEVNESTEEDKPKVKAGKSEASVYSINSLSDATRFKSIGENVVDSVKSGIINLGSESVQPSKTSELLKDQDALQKKDVEIKDEGTLQEKGVGDSVVDMPCADNIRVEECTMIASSEENITAAGNSAVTRPRVEKVGRPFIVFCKPASRNDKPSNFDN